MRIAFVEPRQASQFTPIALARPVFELLCGTRSVRQRTMDVIRPQNWGVVVRPHLCEIYRQEFPDAAVNDPDWLNADDVLLVNGLWMGDPNLLIEDGKPLSLVKDNTLVSWYRKSSQQGDLIGSIVDQFSSDNLPEACTELTSGFLANYPWDLVSRNAEMIGVDYSLESMNRAEPVLPTSLPKQIRLAEWQDHIWIHPTAHLEPYVSINAEKGPVIVDAGAKIQSFTRLEGPCYIGRDTELFRANVRGETSIGPVCRVGGEVEASIIHGYANKYHDGFLGHSYVCPWVNLGALTTNSDLKNDYSNVKVSVGEKYLATGEKKVGCFIGDHAKTAIGTLFNTGTNVGVMAMVLPAGKLCPKHIPSFSRLWQGKLDEHFDWHANAKTAETAMSRRELKWTDTHRRLFEEIQKLTEAERKKAISRSRG